MSRKLVLASIVLLLTAFVAVAQTDVEAYLSAAGNASNLYRGRKALEYKFPFNGTFYWESPLYHPGRVCYNNKIYDCDALNIDAAQQELLVKDHAGVISVMLNRDYVSWFETGGRKFIHPRVYFNDPSLPEGFFEVLYDGRVKVLCQTLKMLDKVSHPEMADTGTEGVPILANVLEVFQRRISCYYVNERDEFLKVTRRKDIYQRYPEHKRELRRAIAAEEPDEIVLSLPEFARIAVEIGEGLR